MKNSNFRVLVHKGRKAGVSHPIPLGELSIGTTLDSQFFIGCADMWHQLLCETTSADHRSASPSRDALPEQLMRIVLTHELTGLSLRVEQGFAEVGHRRLLPGDSCTVKAATGIRMGATELEVQVVERSHDEADHSGIQVGSLTEAKTALNELPVGLSKHRSFPQWMNSRAAIAGFTAVAVAVLSLAMLSKRAPVASPIAVGSDFSPPEPEFDSEIAAEVDALVAEQAAEAQIVADIDAMVAEQAVDAGIVADEADLKPLSAQKIIEAHDGHIFNERIVAVVSSEPAFLMTESGERYNLGAEVDNGFRISLIDANAIEFTRGAEIRSHKF